MNFSHLGHFEYCPFCTISNPSISMVLVSSESSLSGGSSGVSSRPSTSTSSSVSSSVTEYLNSKWTFWSRYFGSET